jgi:hypothetical protein
MEPAERGRSKLTEDEADDREARVVDGSGRRDHCRTVEHDDKVDVLEPGPRILRMGNDAR